MGKVSIYRVILVLVIYFSSSYLHAQSVPQLISYQGQLTDGSGNPLQTDEYKLSFKIYADASGGNSAWGPQVFNAVPVVRGHFNVILGPLDSNNDSIIDAFKSNKSYLEVTVGNESPIVPRQQILSTPYALYALHGVPIGSIQAYWGNSEPEGWLFCDGRGLSDPGLENDKYKSLKQHITNLGFSALPDMKNRFLWGSLDPADQTLLNQQGGERSHMLTVDEMPKHVHQAFFETAPKSIGHHHMDIERMGASRNHWSNTEATGGNQSHNNMPPYLTVNFIIKY